MILGAASLSEPGFGWADRRDRTMRTYSIGLGGRASLASWIYFWIPPDASARGGSDENSILMGESDFMGFVGGAIRVNAPPFFQDRMDHVLQDLSFCRCHIDTIIVWSSTLEEHLEHVEEVFRRLREFGLKVHPVTCVFRAESIDFLGLHISARSLEPQQDKMFETSLPLQMSLS